MTQNIQDSEPKSQEPQSEFRPEAELFQLALLQQQTGDAQSALETYRKLLTLNSKNVTVLNNMGVILKEQGQLSEAAALLRRAIDIEPGYDKAYTNLGVVLQLQNQSRAAIEFHLRALALNEQNWESAVNLGLLYWSEGDLEAAKRFFWKAIGIRRHASVFHYLGLTFEQQGQRPEAIHHYRQALKAEEGLTPKLRGEIQRRLRTLIGGDEVEWPRNATR